MTRAANSLAAKIAREFGRLYHDGRGSVEQICDGETSRVYLFLDAMQEPIIRGLLPHVGECTDGGHIAFVFGADGKDILRFSDDFARWFVRGEDKPFSRAGVKSLMEFMGYGRPLWARDFMMLLGVAAARVLLADRAGSAEIKKGPAA